MICLWFVCISEPNLAMGMSWSLEQNYHQHGSHEYVSGSSIFPGLFRDTGPNKTAEGLHVSRQTLLLPGEYSNISHLSGDVCCGLPH